MTFSFACLPENIARFLTLLSILCTLGSPKKFPILLRPTNALYCPFSNKFLLKFYSANRTTQLLATTVHSFFCSSRKWYLALVLGKFWRTELKLRLVQLHNYIEIMSLKDIIISDSEDYNYQKLRKIRNPQNHHIIEAMNNDMFKYLLNLLDDNDLDPAIREKWAVLLKEFFRKD